MKTVLICPMDWGLGHASRDVELIDTYIKTGFNVIIGADKAPLKFLQQHFPQLQYIVLRSMSIHYSKHISFKLKMLISLPKILYGIYLEHKLLKKLLQNHKIDIVISDNRYGLWNKNVHSIFISHQIWVKVSTRLHFIEKFANYINHLFIQKFNECWIPDFKGKKSLAGELSQPKKLPQNAKYIGLLSRFKSSIKFYNNQNVDLLSQKFDILTIISGPEPQRSIFETIITNEISKSKYKALILQGNPEKNNYKIVNNITFINHVDTYNLRKLILNTEIIICRSGYSSIMDLMILKKKAILVPTPGQTEQEYLSEYLSEKQLFCSTKQNKFNLEKMIVKLNNLQIDSL